MDDLFAPVPGAIVRPGAQRDLRQTLAYIGQSNPQRAVRFAQALLQTLEELVAMPHLGSPRELADSRFHNLRQWPVQGFKNYLIFYQSFASSNGIEVVRVLHASRDAPLHLSDETAHDES